jgi:hypothetical protein
MEVKVGLYLVFFFFHYIYDFILLYSTISLSPITSVYFLHYHLYWKIEFGIQVVPFHLIILFIYKGLEGLGSIFR